MEISSTLENDFPLCARYIKNFLSNPDVFAKKYPKVWKAFIYACTHELNSGQKKKAEEFAKQALTLGKKPKILTMKDKRRCGLFHPGPEYFNFPTQNLIKISEEACNTYERPNVGWTGWKVFEGTLLHELVHWVRFNAAGTGNFIMSNEGEVGDVFVLKAYGFFICLREKGKLKVIGPPGTEP